MFQNNWSDLKLLTKTNKVRHCIVYIALLLANARGRSGPNPSDNYRISYFKRGIKCNKKNSYSIHFNFLSPSP